MPFQLRALILFLLIGPETCVVSGDKNEAAGSDDFGHILLRFPTRAPTTPGPSPQPTYSAHPTLETPPSSNPTEMPWFSVTSETLPGGCPYSRQWSWMGGDMATVKVIIANQDRPCNTNSTNGEHQIEAYRSLESDVAELGKYGKAALRNRTRSALQQAWALAEEERRIARKHVESVRIKPPGHDAGLGSQLHVWSAHLYRVTTTLGLPLMFPADSGVGKEDRCVENLGSQNRGLGCFFEDIGTTCEVVTERELSTLPKSQQILLSPPPYPG